MKDSIRAIIAVVNDLSIAYTSALEEENNARATLTRDKCNVHNSRGYLKQCENFSEDLKAELELRLVQLKEQL